MSFFALGSAAATAIGGSAAIGLTGTALSVAGAVGGAAAAYGGQKLLNKATSGSSSGSVGSLPSQTLDIDKIIADSRAAAAENYRTSLALEAENNPGQAAFRNAANSGLTQLANAAPFQFDAPGYTGSRTVNYPGAANPGYTGARSVGYTAPAARTFTGNPVEAYTGTPQGNSLLSESADSILQSLRLGGALPADVQSQITRAALSKAGQAGLSGSAAARGLVARDIGTNSLALLNARQQQAIQAGSLLEQLGLGRAQFGLDQSRFGLDVDKFGLDADRFGLQQAQFGLEENRFGLDADRFGLLQAQFGLDQNRFGLETDKLGLEASRFGLDQFRANNERALNLGVLANNMALPNPGLDPGAIASLYVGENNSLNQNRQNQFLIDQQNANRRNDQLNQLLGFGSQALTTALSKPKKTEYTGQPS